MDVDDAKKTLRAEVRTRLAALAPTRRALEEELVTAAIQATPQWHAARTVLLYRSVAPEFATVALTLGAWRAGKRTLFPRVGQGGAMTLHEVRSWGEMRPGALGIPEPTATATVDASAVDLAVVPGVAWTAHGDRLGRGGGHFDRLLPRLRTAWGVGFDCQVLAAVPTAPHDRPVGRVWAASLLDEAKN